MARLYSWDKSICSSGWNFFVKGGVDLDYEELGDKIFKVKLRVTDNGNPAMSNEKDVFIHLRNVEDSDPIITLDGDNPMYLEVGESFVEPGYVCKHEGNNCNYNDLVVDGQA